MKDISECAPPKRRQKTQMRFLWFFAGAAVNYLLIRLPFQWLETHTALPLLAISACSIGVSASFFFLWNYFINFRGESRKRDAFPRYLGAVLLMSVLSFGEQVVEHSTANLSVFIGSTIAALLATIGLQLRKRAHVK